jgi:hypothetical protein
MRSKNGPGPVREDVNGPTVRDLSGEVPDLRPKQARSPFQVSLGFPRVPKPHFLLMYNGISTGSKIGFGSNLQVNYSGKSKKRSKMAFLPKSEKMTIFRDFYIFST